VRLGWHSFKTQIYKFQVPLERPQGGTEYSAFSLKFMCLGSDVGGINRKPLKVIFTLEQGPGTVIGRYSVDVRICSCPKRDKQQEEARHQVNLGDISMRVLIVKLNPNNFAFKVLKDSN
jgi:hypothetical protein